MATLLWAWLKFTSQLRLVQSGKTLCFQITTWCLRLDTHSDAVSGFQCQLGIFIFLIKAWVWLVRIKVAKPPHCRDEKPLNQTGQLSAIDNNRCSGFIFLIIRGQKNQTCCYHKKNQARKCSAIFIDLNTINEWKVQHSSTSWKMCLTLRLLEQPIFSLMFFPDYCLLQREMIILWFFCLIPPAYKVVLIVSHLDFWSSGSCHCCSSRPVDRDYSISGGKRSIRGVRRPPCILPAEPPAFVFSFYHDVFSVFPRCLGGI